MKKQLTGKLVLFFMLNALCIYAQGSVNGTVIDSLTTDKLKNAEIILSGTNYQTLTNNSGEFTLNAVPAGEYILRAAYFGYAVKNCLITVKTGESVVIKIEMVPVITDADGSIFTAHAKSQAEEINLQLRSNTIKNFVTTQKLRDLPDENISVSLSRLPGVSVHYGPVAAPDPFLGGGSLTFSENIIGLFSPPIDDFPIIDDPVSRVLVRGLDSKFYNVYIDGVKVLPTSAKDKSVDLGIISGRDFQNLELHKSVASDEDGDGTAGSVNIISGTAPSERKIRADLSGNYNGLDKSSNQYFFKGNYGERFFDNTLGIQAGVHAEKMILSSEYTKAFKPLYGSGFLSYTNAEREKYGAELLFDFITPGGGSVKFNNIFYQTKSDYFDNSADTIFYALHKKIYSSKKTEQRIFISSLSGSHRLFGLDIDWKAAFSDSKNDHPYYYSLAFYEIFLSPTVSKFALDNSIDSRSKNYSKEKTASVNISKTFGYSDEITGEVKFGGKYSVNSVNYDENLSAENASLKGSYQYLTLSDGSKVLKDFSGTRFDGLVGRSKNDISLTYFLDNPAVERTLFDKYKVDLINKDALNLWRRLNHNEYNPDEGPGINSYSFSGGILAGYISLHLNFGRSVKFITGIRIESEHNDFSGYYFTNTITYVANLYNAKPEQTKTYNYDRAGILPNIQVILKPVDFLNLRLSAYKTVIRPDYNARAPKYFAVNIDQQHNYLNIGNPDLENADVWNYEFQTQFHGKIIGLLNINGFYKDIKGLQQQLYGIRLSGTSVVESLGIDRLKSIPVNYPFNTQDYNFYSYYNSPKPASIWGIEIEHLANFSYLPGALKNIILNYNLSIVRSETWMPDLVKIAASTNKDLLFFQKQRILNMPAFLANIILGYDIDGCSFRISYYYQDGYTIADNVYNLELRGNKISRLDIGLKQKVLENVSVILNVNNVTDLNETAVLKDSGRGTEKTAQNFKSGTNFGFGIRIEL